jgi:hypothetical protein
MEITALSIKKIRVDLLLAYENEVSLTMCLETGKGPS